MLRKRWREGRALRLVTLAHLSAGLGVTLSEVERSGLKKL